jgi:cytochrome c oxidase subunit 3
MSSSSSASAGHEKYYVPESSSLAVRATIGLILSVFGAALVLNDMTYGSGGESSNSVWVLTAGLVFFIFTLASWFGTAIRENLAGMNSGQLHQSYVLGMFWFIFSEVMFFAAFFGALLYVRQFVGPWLAGEGEGGRMNGLLWPGFEFAWPPVTTPQEVVGGVDAQVIANNGGFVSQEKSMAPAD